MHTKVSFLLMAMALIAAGGAQAQAPADPYSYTRTSSFAYDPGTGLLMSETVEPGMAKLCVTTSYLYDAYGNKQSATTANCAGASGTALFTSRSNSTTFATQTVTVAGTSVTIPAGQFPTVVTNALNQSESKKFDPRFGATTSLTGPNGLTTTWQLDDFGRPQRESRADGTSTVNAYCLIAGKVTDTSSNSANCPTPAAGEVPSIATSFIHTEVRDAADQKSGPFSRVYVDAKGRKLRTVTESFDGATQPGGTARLIAQDTDYNAQGAPVATTQPYFLDTKASSSGGANNSVGVTLTTYDTLGRPTAIYVADPQGSTTFGYQGRTIRGAVTRVSYSGLDTVSTNDKGQTHKEEKNVDGKIVRVTDALGAQIAHQYDAFGNLIATKDALQNVAAATFDIRGRKIAMSDPDEGTWNYDFNALGETVVTAGPNHNAIGKNTTMSYDLLGRMIQRIDPEYTSNWYYDKYADGSVCNKGTGKLCESRTSNGLNRKLYYDNLGRAVSARADVLNGPSFASAISYDSTSGRPSSQTYPTGLKVNFNYTGKGFLSTMTLATSATVNPLPATLGGTPGAGATLAAGSVLWKAQAYSAWGKVEQQVFGNNVLTTSAYDASTGRIDSIKAGVGAATAAMNYSYAWDSLSHLTGRTDANGDGVTGPVTDGFIYDDIGRLQSYSVSASAIPSLQRNVTLQYNALGMVLAKSDVGVYTYGPQGFGAHPHALQSVSGAIPTSFTYDGNGNMKTASAGSYRSVSYTSFNLPDSQTGLAGPAGGSQYTWQYDENHQRIKETQVTSAGTRTTWMMHPDNAGGLSFESEQGTSGTSNRHYLTAGGMSIGVLVSTGSLPTLASAQSAPTALTTINLNKVEYWHKDHLGSLVSTTDHNGAVTARYSYDPFGKRRTTGGNYDANGVLVYDWNSTNSGTDRGFTGHEELDDVGVVHMNGRLYDPRLGIFMQGDPYIQDPLNLQNFNRYGYCYNNPMTCSDPTGQVFGWDDMAYALIIIWTAEKAGIIDVHTARTLTSIAFTVASGTPSGIGEAAAIGFESGVIASGNVKGGLQGAFSAGMFYGAGNVIGGGNFFTGGQGAAWGTGARIALHGVVGCVTSVAGGGKCGPGALSAAFTKAMAPATAEATNGNAAAGVAISAVIGGTASVLGGGKFANGAQTGAFSYLFNQLSHVSLPGAHPLSGDNPVHQLWDETTDAVRELGSKLKVLRPDSLTLSAGIYVVSTSVTISIDGDVFWGYSAEWELKPKDRAFPSKIGLAVMADWIDDGQNMAQAKRKEIIDGPQMGYMGCARLCFGRSYSPDQETGGWVRTNSLGFGHGALNLNGANAHYIFNIFEHKW